MSAHGNRCAYNYSSEGRMLLFNFNSTKAVGEALRVLGNAVDRDLRIIEAID